MFLTGQIPYLLPVNSYTSLKNLKISEIMRTFRSFSRSKGMGAIFQKKGNKMLKRDKYLKIWANMYKI